LAITRSRRAIRGERVTVAALALLVSRAVWAVRFIRLERRLDALRAELKPRIRGGPPLALRHSH
jgi:hypothetical protein